MKKDFAFNRRAFVKTSLQLCAGFALSSPILALASKSSYGPLSFYHTHTGERLKLDAAAIGHGGSALDELNTFLHSIGATLSIGALFLSRIVGKDNYTKLIKDEALRLGFSSVGIARAEFLKEEAPKLENWLKNGYQGDKLLVLTM